MSSHNPHLDGSYSWQASSKVLPNLMPLKDAWTISWVGRPLAGTGVHPAEVRGKSKAYIFQLFLAHSPLIKLPLIIPAWLVSMGFWGVLWWSSPLNEAGGISRSSGVCFTVFLTTTIPFPLSSQNICSHQAVVFIVPKGDRNKAFPNNLQKKNITIQAKESS